LGAIFPIKKVDGVQNFQTPNMHLRQCFLYPRKFVKNTNLKLKIKKRRDFGGFESPEVRGKKKS
jgi:hypothetical protein